MGRPWYGVLALGHASRRWADTRQPSTTAACPPTVRWWVLLGRHQCVMYLTLLALWPCWSCAVVMVHTDECALFFRQCSLYSADSSMDSCLRHTPSLQVATGSGDRCVRVWQTMTGSLLHELPLQQGSRVKSMAFDKAVTIAVVVLFDSTVSVWNLKTGTVVVSCQGLSLTVYEYGRHACAWSD